jgi:hypothetical protein
MAPSSTNAFGDASSLQHYQLTTSSSPDVDSTATAGVLYPPSSSSSSSLASAHADVPAVGTLSEDALREFLFFDIGGAADHDDVNGAAAAADFDINLDSLLAVDELTAVYSPPGNTASCDEAHPGGRQLSDDQRGTAVGRACVVALFGSPRGHGEEEALLFSSTSTTTSSP